MHLLAWVRLMVARHPWAYWLVVAVIACTVALVTAQAMAGVDAARRSWGEQQEVWRATAPIEAGQPIVASHEWAPRALVPAEAVTVAPGEAVARQRIGAGEIITDSDVAAPGPSGLIPDGSVAFALPSTLGHLTTGDHVRVYSGDQLVAAGLVVDVGESDVMVAVPTEAAPAMSTALLADSVTLALSPNP